MAARFRARLTYANVMATLALFVALAGTSYAALTITGKNVKNGSLTGADIKDGSLLVRDFRTGQIPAGPVGPQGVKGDTGAAGATKAVVRTSSGHGVVITSCEPGETATGGGGHSPDGYVVASGPASHPQAFFSTNQPPTQYATSTTWESRAVKVTYGPGSPTVSDADVTTWVVCVAP